MAAIRRADSPPTPVPARRLSPGWIAAAVTAVVLGLISLNFPYIPEPEEAAALDGAPPGEVAALVEEAMPVFTLPTRVQMDEWSRRLDEPLQVELDSVVKDTKAALNGLANNFVPDKFMASSFGHKRDH